MDRHFLAGVMLGIVVLSGCSQAPPDAAARPSAAPSTNRSAAIPPVESGPVAAQTHRPIIVSSESFDLGQSLNVPVASPSGSGGTETPPAEQPRSFAPQPEDAGAKP